MVAHNQEIQCPFLSSVGSAIGAQKYMQAEHPYSNKWKQIFDFLFVFETVYQDIHSPGLSGLELTVIPLPLLG